MARIRTIKPEFFTSEDIVSLTPMARLLYISTWCEADKEGRLLWKPQTFKLRYFPGDACDIKAMCRELVDAGLVVLYGDGLAYIPGFSRHQHVNPRESKSELPEPDACARVNDASVRDSDAQGGREGKGREGLDTGVPVSVDGDADRPALALVPSKTGIPDCPHQALIALYAKHLPHLRQPMTWDGPRVEAMRQRWRKCAGPTAFGDGYSTEAEGLAFWTRFFEFVATCPKLRDGITSREGGQVRIWKPDLPWLMKAENFAKVIEGTYA